MRYEKPKCECGKELFVVEERTQEIATKINKTGKINKRKIVHNNDVGLPGASWLECECGKEYELEFVKGKVVRGDNRC